MSISVYVNIYMWFGFPNNNEREKTEDEKERQFVEKTDINTTKKTILTIHPL